MSTRPFTALTDEPGHSIDFIRNWHLLGIPSNGLGVDLVQVTNRLYPDNTREVVMQRRAYAERMGTSIMPTPRDKRSERFGPSKMGQFCEQPTCMGSKLTANMLKRCAKCLQVSYCGKECQRLDWPRRK
ncbi:uncharacterized protein PHACADRAFT_193906 [Phanerochaete carnosa HHB-10118-sp]|uniref:MYND-type domain-containing protein n=1 Tax=Phanerochaete carnosa (strain HHB-10118-sp) TaxID=650164 RepID=K5X0L5_PHACS|nr:uncharacterized protein PHACADRAFT_193906 [Phanerochaete carnosa HHB-10118-sp]EKM56287.1 hypothetical protein PHACADRAFT_193906 [Phanerochaete carnosa HHB-10118-sp]